MSFRKEALSFAEDLVDYVLEHYSKVQYKAASPDYRLTRKVRGSGIVVDPDGGMFRPIVGKAAVFLQPYFESKMDEIDCTVRDQIPEFFEPVKFLGCCSLVTLEMARGYFYKGNRSILESTAWFIMELLSKYHQNGSFLDDDPTWEGKPSSSWAAIYETARSILNFRQVFLKSREFVPEVSPPATPEPVLPSGLFPQCHPPNILVAQLYDQIVYEESLPTVC